MTSILSLVISMLLIRIGQATYAAGASRSKNAAGAALRSLCDLCVSTLAFWAVGAALMLRDPHYLFGWSGQPEPMLYALIVVLIGTGAVGATLAERSKLSMVIASSVILSALIIPLAVFLVWPGFLPAFHDAGGAAVIHVSAGACALAGAIVLGPRSGKYNRDGSTSMIPGHNVPLSAIGTLIMIAGFVPYVMLMTVGPDGRSSYGPGYFAPSGVNAIVSIAAGGAAALLVSRIRYGKVDIGFALLGALGGAVAITAAGGFIGSPAAFITGAVAGAIVPLASVTLDLVGHVDDPAGAVSVHLVGGLWGTLSAGLFRSGSFTQRIGQFGVQLLGVVIVLAVAAAISFGVFIVLKKTVGIRASDADEYDGLDLAEHDIGAYPDFQQTMIKSYHLREA